MTGCDHCGQDKPTVLISTICTRCDSDAERKHQSKALGQAATISDLRESERALSAKVSELADVVVRKEARIGELETMMKKIAATEPCFAPTAVAYAKKRVGEME